MFPTWNDLKEDLVSGFQLRSWLARDLVAEQQLSGCEGRLQAGIDLPLGAALYLLSITYITAAAQNGWQNNVFKIITLQLMASFRSSLSHLAREWSPRSVPSTAPFKMMSSADYTHLDSIWKCIHIYLVYLHCICIDHWRVKVKLSKSNQHMGTYGAVVWSPPSGSLPCLLWCPSEIYLNHIKLDIKMCRHIHHSKWCGGASLAKNPTSTIGL